MRVGRRALDGSIAYGPDYQVSLAVSEGSVVPGSGITDADGYVSAGVTVHPPVEFVTVFATATTAQGESGAAAKGAAVRQPPPSVPGVFEVMVCDTVLQFDIDHLPISVSRNVDEPLNRACTGSVEITGTRHPDGRLELEGLAETTRTAQLAGPASWILVFHVPERYEYEVELEVEGLWGLAALWRGTGSTPTVGNVRACASMDPFNPPSWGITCPPEATGTGPADPGISMRLRAATRGSTRATARLTLAPDR